MVNFEVQKLSTPVPLATTTCGHDRQMGYNLREGIAVHIDDGSSCRRTGLSDGVDEEFASLDRLSEKVQSLLADASAQLDAKLFGDGRPR